jgi:uncharacterized protein (DUF169 family)
MSLPTALTQGMVTSAGCLGNRIYTGLGEDELYIIIPGRFLQKIADAVLAIAESHSKIEEYHHERRKTLRTPIE